MSISQNFPTSDSASLAKEVAKLIAQVEKDYQNAINQTYLELSEKTFKSLRRALPITKQKLDWNRSVCLRV
jgi:capping protein alpha